MKFSVIIPVYNMEKYLEDAMNSILPQLSNDDEIVLINDGSTDSSLNICEKYVKENSNILLINKENTGSMDSWMKGVLLSKGDYIVFVDADDLIENNYFDVLKEKCTDADIILFNHYNYYINEKEIVKTDSIDYGYYDEEKLYEIKKNIIKNPALYSFYRWNKAFKRKILINSMKYINSISTYYEDCPIGLLSLLESKSLLFIEDSLYNYRMRKSSVSHKVKEKVFTDNVLIEKEMENIIKASDIYDDNDLYCNHLYFLFQYCRWAMQADFKVKRKCVFLKDIKMIKGNEKKVILILYKFRLKFVFKLINCLRKKIKKNAFSYFE